MNQLDGIKQFTTVVADSGDIESIRHYQPEDATTNPSLLLKAAGLAHFSHLIDDALAYGKQRGKTQEQQVAEASDTPYSAASAIRLSVSGEDSLRSHLLTA